MSESPNRRSRPPQAETSRPLQPARAALNETARAADSVPLSVGPFAALPTQFGRYRIEKLLGNGTMGAVYLAHDVQLDRPVALKVARISTAGSAKLIKRMETEAKAAAKIDHPLVCKVYDFGEIDGIRFIALQYIEGEDLKSYFIRVGRKREPAEALRLVLQMSRALAAAHDKGVIHRDLKPENVMLNQSGEPVIMDFGLARRLTGATNAGLTQGMILGTAAYMSPEQAIGKAEGIDHRSDLYAIGVMFFEMLTGEWPFTGTAIEVMGRKVVQEAPSVLSLNPHIPAQLAAICDRLTAKKKEDRFANGAALVAALEAIDLQASVPLEMEVEFASFEPPAPPSWLKPAKPSPVSPQFPGSNGRLKPVVTWWRSQPLAMRATLIGCGAILVVILAFSFVPMSPGIVQIDIDNPTLSVRFGGNLITTDTDGQQVRMHSGTDSTLEILQHGKVISSVTTKLAVAKGERQRLRVSLRNDQMIVVSGQATAPTGAVSDIRPQTALLPEMTSRTTGMRLALIPAGTFRMGSPETEAQRASDESPQHTVRITKPFYLGVYEVTQGEYEQVTRMRPSWFAPGGKGHLAVAGQDTSRFPVEQVSWFDSIEFCNLLSERDGRPSYYQLSNVSRTDGSIEAAIVSVVGGIGYRLPTEAEWEYACRANTTTLFSFGSEGNGEQANVDGRFPCGTLPKGPFLNRTTTVGSYSRNAFGLFDMHGNVGEWCEDYYDPNAYRTRPKTTNDPLTEKWGLNQLRVWRGGFWSNSSCQGYRSAYRSVHEPDSHVYSLGVRVACSAPVLPTAASTFTTDTASAVPKSITSVR